MPFIEWGLAIATVLLAVAGIALAALALIGYFGVRKWARKEAHAVATAVAEEKMNDYLQDSNIREKIEQEVKKQGNTVFQDLVFSQPQIPPTMNDKE